MINRKKNKQNEDERPEGEEQEVAAEEVEANAPETEDADSDSIEAADAAQLRDRLQRLVAEYQNFRKQSERRNVETRRFIRRDFIQQLLPIVDHFGAAMTAHEQGQDPANVLFGVKMIHEMFHKFLEDNGVKAIEALGKDFDPKMHEAVERKESDEAAENSILSEIQRGYAMDELVVRPARVVVAAPRKEETAGEPEEPSDEEE